MDNILSLLPVYVLLSSVVILAVMAIKLASKNKLNPIIISMLWIIVLLRLIVPFSIDSPVHIPNIFALKNAPAAYEAADENAANQQNATPQHSEDISADILPIINTDTLNLNPADYEPVLTTQMFFQRALNYIKTINYKYLITIVWAAVAFGIIYLSMSSLRVFIARAKVKHVKDERLPAALKSAKAALNMTLKVTLLESEKIDVPITYGLILPKIIVPSKMAETMDYDKIRLILMHELMHIKRRDILKNYLWLIAKAIHWFNPLVWIAYKRYVSDTEIICDYYVSQCLTDGEKVSYTQSLLDIAKHVQENIKHSAPIMLYFCEENTKLRRRIMNILQPVKQSRRQFIIIGLITALLIMACFTTACFGTSSADEPAENEYTSEPAPETATAAPKPTPDARDDALVYGPYLGHIGGWVDNELLINGSTINITIDIPLKKEPQHDYYPVLDIKTAEIEADAIDSIADYLLGDGYTSEESYASEYVSLKSQDNTAGLSVLTVDGKYSHLHYYSEDYYYEPVARLESRAESLEQFNSEYVRANELIRRISNDYLFNNIFLGKEIPKDMANQGDMDADEFEDCVIFRYAPAYHYSATEFEVMYYKPALPVISTDERFEKLLSSYYEPANPLTAEYIDIVLKDNKIVDVVWNGYSKITNITKNESIISYDDAYEIFSDNICESAFWESDIATYYELIITDIEFGLVRVDNQMVPAYTFIGTRKSVANANVYEDYKKTDVAAFMIINAIDGSRIIVN